jgi:AraC-like DNA-binding protein
VLVNDTSIRLLSASSRARAEAGRLAKPESSVIDVATRGGFDSGSAFARDVGETPSAYRRRVQGGAD